MVKAMTTGVELAAGATTIQQRANAEVQHQLITAARSHLESDYYKFIQVRRGTYIRYFGSVRH